jgi:rubrerythrin
MTDARIVDRLAESRRREKAQTLFYRVLAAAAETALDPVASERLNELHADEQHHLSRLTARLLEMGGVPAPLDDVPAPEAPFDGWEQTAREREREEVRWYETLLSEALDPTTRDIVLEIVESERRHEAELGGKWMSA